jgi:ribosome maturation factor RimP
MSVHDQAEAVRAAVAPLVDALGLELYDVELLGHGAARTLRVSIAAPDGIDLDAITATTNAISPVLDTLPELTGPYLLEVSSPGVERSLRLPSHYRGAVGEQVAVKYHTDAGPRRVKGTLVAAGDGDVTVDVDGTLQRISYTDVTHARTVFEWEPKPPPGSPSKSRTRAKERT